MKYNKLLLLSFGTPVLCLATSLLSHAGECALLDQIAATAVTRSDRGMTALDLLEKVALGHSADISPESEAQVGVAAGQLRQKGFSSSEARVCVS
jgi:hypothetical protein